ncbi:GL26696 [Drosophila persimilis]|uniref:GL26696 n=1 Tax=Drosophila persimilis TaxID=7234 RepID=B4GS89_DROPE|nr:forkhead box protein B2 [Drosophila persimilis]EDW25636.1 GL26696 [Drosophila persimilis]
MAPSNLDYQTIGGDSADAKEIYTHKKFKTSNYTHKKFGKKSSSGTTTTSTSTPLFRPYALSENTPRKRRQESEREVQHTLPPTPPTTPPQLQHPHTHSYPYPQPQQPQYLATPTATPSPMLYAYMLQKQRAVLQMRQLLSINPDASTWPVEWRQALQALLQQ